MMKSLHILILSFLFVSLPVMGAGNLTELKNRTNIELKDFTEITGMASNFKSLAPASSLGIWGFDAGVELTTIPSAALQIGDKHTKLPTFFPRLSVAKGLTPNLDFEASALIPSLAQNQLDLPDTVKNMLIYGGALKYMMLEEGLLMPVSLAVRASYTRVSLDFFSSDTYGGDISVSRELSLPFMPFSFTPYFGAGYISINGDFNIEQIDLLKAKSKHAIQDYRYFAGASVKILFFELTGQADFANPKEANTFSLKLGVDL